MIIIKESKCSKLPGLSSAYIESPYNPALTYAIKKYCELAYWHKDEKVWEVPIKNISLLLEYISCLDDITIYGLAELNTDTSNVKLDLTGIKTTPRSYQLEAVKYGHVHKRFLLLDDMGLGKTASSIYLAQSLKNEGKVNKCLIICGVNSIKLNWEKQIAVHSHLDSVVIGKKVSAKGNIRYTSIKKRVEQLKEKIDEFFVIINIESIREKSVVDAINNSQNKYDMIIFDECHVCKDANTSSSIGLLSLSAPYMVAMSGTLLANNASDCFVPLKWIGVETGLLTNFKKYYCVFYNNDETSGQIVGYKNLDVLKEELSSCSLRRLKKDELKELPPKTVIPVYVELSNENRKIYDDTVHCIKKDIDLIKLYKDNPRAMTTRLRQALVCPQLLTSNPCVATKLIRCTEMVNEILSNGRKAVVFSTFKEPVYQLAEMLKMYDPLVITGDTKGDPLEITETFQHDESKKLIIATYSKIGVGIELTSASDLIFIDCPWTAWQFNQASDRIYRMGSKSPVFIYTLICQDTIDELVDRLIHLKADMTNYIIDNELDEESEFAKKLLDREIRTYLDSL